MKMHDLRGAPLSELQQHLQDAETELSNLAFQQATHQINNPLKIRTTRRGIARLKTLIHQETLGIRTRARAEGTE